MTLTIKLYLFSLGLLSSLFSFTTQAYVPSFATFKYVNDAKLDPLFLTNFVEYGATIRPLDVYNSPFQLSFYNTTPNAFYLAILMGASSDSVLRWVWEANRNNPVGENAMLTFGKNGNLVLADVDGRIVWQTNTANKGVIGLKLLRNGNLVLHNSKGKFIWQSFDYPTDTLLAGQSFRLGVANKLISRASERDASNGAYSFIMESKRLAMYYKSPKSPKSLTYYTSSYWFDIEHGPLEYMTQYPNGDIFNYDAYEVQLEYHVANSEIGGSLTLTQTKYNTTLSFLRLDIDGNLRLYSYYDKVRPIGAWDVTFTFFTKDTFIGDSECQLPQRCGDLGVCEDNQCVACPTSSGLMGWSKDCKLPKLTSCAPKDFRYIKFEGMDHFMCKYTKGDGPMRLDQCDAKCTVDCKCLGFFYHEERSRCWIAYDLKTLLRVPNSTHVACIKFPMH